MCVAGPHACNFEATHVALLFDLGPPFKKKDFSNVVIRGP